MRIFIPLDLSSLPFTTPKSERVQNSFIHAQRLAKDVTVLTSFTSEGCHSADSMRQKRPYFSIFFFRRLFFSLRGPTVRDSPIFISHSVAARGSGGDPGRVARKQLNKWEITGIICALCLRLGESCGNATFLEHNLVFNCSFFLVRSPRLLLFLCPSFFPHPPERQR